MNIVQDIATYGTKRPLLTLTDNRTYSNILYGIEYNNMNTNTNNNNTNNTNNMQLIDEFELMGMLLNSMKGIETSIISTPNPNSNSNTNTNAKHMNIRIPGRSVITTNKIIQFFRNIFIFRNALTAIQNCLLLMPSIYGYKSLVNTIEQLCCLYDSSVDSLHREILERHTNSYQDQDQYQYQYLHHSQVPVHHSITTLYSQ